MKLFGKFRFIELAKIRKVKDFSDYYKDLLLQTGQVLPPIPQITMNDPSHRMVATTITAISAVSNLPRWMLAFGILFRRKSLVLKSSSINSKLLITEKLDISYNSIDIVKFFIDNNIDCYIDVSTVNMQIVDKNDQLVGLLDCSIFCSIWLTFFNKTNLTLTKLRID
jgi:hypothetical protein